MDWLDKIQAMPLFRNSPLDGLIAIALFIGLFLLLVAIRRWIRRYHARLLATDATEIAEIPVEVLSRTTSVFFLAVSFFIALKTLNMSVKTAVLLNSILTVALFFQVGVWGAAAAKGMLERKRRRSLVQDRAAAGSLGIIAFIAQVVIWAMVALLTLDNLGVDVTALVAGLGIGGVAIALAVQNILGDLFASLSITFDKPFVIGDFLIVGDFMGSVENIGIKSTRLRSLSGEQIIMSNADLLGSRVRNYGRMAERRVVFTLSVVYETPVDVLESIPAIVRAAIEENQMTRFDRAHFAKYAESSLDFETVYYVLSADFNRYMDIQQAINLRIYREFERRGIEFAYPTQKLYLTRQQQARKDAA